MRDETRYLRAPASDDDGFEGLATPVHRTSTVVFPDTVSFERRYENFYDGWTYGLYGTPTTRTLEARLAELGGAAGAILTPSGQSALTLVLSTFAGPGDRILVADNCYGPVRAFCDRVLSRRGVTVDYFDPAAGGGVARLLDDRTRIVLVETPGSITMEFADLPAIARAAHGRGCLVAVDNTWGSALLHKAHARGADISVEALSKHVSGHGDLLMGAITVTNPAFGRALKDACRLVGLGVSSDDAALALRGLQTLAVRMSRSAESGKIVAELLGKHPAIQRVLHPAFPEFSGHEVWRRDFAGCNGVFTTVFRPEARGAVPAFVDALSIFRIGASWGGTHSLVAPLDPTTSRSIVPWRGGKVVRFSVGLEDVRDLVDDIERALRVFATEPGTVHAA